MKSFFKKTIIMFSVIFFIVTMLFITYNYGVGQELLSDYNKNMIATDITYNMLDEQYYYGGLNMINQIFVIALVCFIISSITGMILCVKENSKIKYVLYFIFGNVVYTLIWMFINNIIIEKSFGLIMSSNYIDMFKTTFLSYIIIYFVVIVGGMIANKYRVETLNESLLNNKEKTNKKFLNDKNIKIIKRVVVTILILMLLIFTIIITRRSIILINYSKAVNDLNKETNYHISIENISADGGNTKQLYYKDNNAVIRGNDIIEYYNNNNNELLYIRTKSKTMMEMSRNYPTRSIDIIKNRFFDTTNIRIWTNIKLAFEISINTEKCNGKDCYAVKQDNMILYIDKETYLPVRRVLELTYGTINGEETRKSIENYTYNFGTVTDEDMKIPSKEGYSIIRGN